MSDSIKALRDEARERLTAGRGDDDERLAFVMIDRADLEGVTANPAYLVEAFRREAEHAMALKRIDFGNGGAE